MMRRWWASAAVMALMLSSCSEAGRTHDRWKPADPPVPISQPEPEPLAEPFPELLSEPVSVIADNSKDVPHPGQAYADAEAAIQAYIIALALDVAHAVVAAQSAEAGTLGPELMWYPTLRKVAARQRHVTYAAPRAGNVLRGSDADQPFFVEIIIPCVVHTTSGDGITYEGDAPPTSHTHEDRVLPQGTRTTDLSVIAEVLRPAATAALAALAGIEPKTETVRVTLLFAYRRAHDDVVLLRHAKADPQP